MSRRRVVGVAGVDEKGAGEPYDIGKSVVKVWRCGVQRDEGVEEFLKFGHCVGGHCCVRVVAPVSVLRDLGLASGH